MNGIDDLMKVATLRANGVLSEEEYERLRPRLLKAVMKPNQYPGWMKPLGWYFTTVAVLGLLLLGYLDPREFSNEKLQIQLALNPLFFLILPFGLYWLWRTDSFGTSDEPQHSVNAPHGTDKKPMRLADMIAVVFIGSVLMLGAFAVCITMLR